MSKEISVSEMKTMCEDHAQRMKDTDDASGVSVNLKKEYLIHKIDKASIESLVNTTKFDGAYAIFGLETKSGYKRQTVILVPHDNTGKALPLPGGTTIRGIEDNDHMDPPTKDVIYPGGGSNSDIPQGVQNAFDSLGIS